ncbi:hypothetical protein IT575_04440 [bacterium]|nr:hypothetical protein [bacterium]
MSQDHTKTSDAQGLGGIEPVLHCCACSRIFRLPDSAAPGSIIDCPFCHTRQVLRTMTVFVSDPVVAA